jgi:hypothetical protein
MHAHFVAGCGDLRGQAGCLGDHAAEHEEGGVNLPFRQHPGEQRSGAGIGAVVEGEGNMTGIALAGQLLEGEHPDWSQAGEPWPGLHDGQPSDRTARKDGSLSPRPGVNGT